jgi:hypothetical protein
MRTWHREGLATRKVGGAWVSLNFRFGAGSGLSAISLGYSSRYHSAVELVSIILYALGTKLVADIIMCGAGATRVFFDLETAFASVTIKHGKIHVNHPEMVHVPRCKVVDLKYRRLIP